MTSYHHCESRLAPSPAQFHRRSAIALRQIWTLSFRTISKQNAPMGNAEWTAYLVQSRYQERVTIYLYMHLPLHINAPQNWWVIAASTPRHPTVKVHRLDPIRCPATV